MLFKTNNNEFSIEAITYQQKIIFNKKLFNP